MAKNQHQKTSSETDVPTGRKMLSLRKNYRRNMVVKSVRGRRRYVVFTVPDEIGRTEVLDALSSLASGMPDVKVITSFGGKAVVRCSPSEIDTVASVMREKYPGSESLITSGTLRTLRDAYPELKVPQKKKR